MTRYAQNTAVSTERSRAEIERTLTRYGASKFMYGWDQDQAIIAFQAHDRHIRFRLPLPARDDPGFTTYRRGSYNTYKRTADAAEKAWEQACRQSWRALALVVKAKLEAVSAGISEFEDEFLAYIVMPDGKTISSHVRPAIEHAYETGTMPQLALTSGGAS